MRYLRRGYSSINDAGMMRLGICRSDVQTPLDGKINWGQTGHGCYLFCSNGWVFSHSDATANSGESYSLKFDSGHTVEMRYDPTRGTLKASKGNKQYELYVPPGDYKICAVMRYQGDSVTIE